MTLRAQLLINAVSLTTPAIARVFSFAYRWIRAHFFVGARNASVSVGSIHLCHPNLLSPFPFIRSALPTKHLFGHDRRHGLDVKKKSGHRRSVFFSTPFI